MMRDASNVVDISTNLVWGANKLSGFVANELSGHIGHRGGAYETDGIATGDPENAFRRGV